MGHEQEFCTALEGTLKRMYSVGVQSSATIYFSFGYSGTTKIYEPAFWCQLWNIKVVIYRSSPTLTFSHTGIHQTPGNPDVPGIQKHVGPDNLEEK